MQLVCVSIRSKLLLRKHAILMVKVQIYYMAHVMVKTFHHVKLKEKNTCKMTE